MLSAFSIELDPFVYPLGKGMETERETAAYSTITTELK
jgi:hypothetical protein